MNELKPCPFCGFDYPEIWEHNQQTTPYGQYYTVKCPWCGVEIREQYEYEAVERWNRRANDEILD